MAKAYIPATGRVLVRVAGDEKTETDSGIVLALTQKDKPNRGIIVALGDLPEGEADPGFKSGDTVLYARYGGHDLKLWDIDHVVLSLSDVLLVEQEVDQSDQEPVQENTNG